MQVKKSINIQSSAEEVFSYLVDMDNRKEFIPLLKEVILLDPPPLAVGSRFIEVAHIAGRDIETKYQIIGFETNSQISAKSIKSIFPILASLDLIETNNSVKLTIKLDFELKGLYKLASGIIQGIVNQQTSEILQRVKSRLEK